MAGFAYWLLVRALIARHGTDSVLATVIPDRRIERALAERKE